MVEEKERKWRERERERVMLRILLELELFELANRKCLCFYAAISFLCFPHCSSFVFFCFFFRNNNIFGIINFKSYKNKPDKIECRKDIFN